LKSQSLKINSSFKLHLPQEEKMINLVDRDYDSEDVFEKEEEVRLCNFLSPVRQSLYIVTMHYVAGKVEVIK
jgi:hypothetical protein